MTYRKRKNKSGLLDSLLGFTPGEDVIEWICKNYSGKTLAYKEIERLFILDVEPNYHIGVILSAFDLCNVRIHPNRTVDLPAINMTRAGKSQSSGRGSFIEEYIREIAIFPTLNREEELDLAKLMEVAYIRYKSSVCFCPATLDFLEKEFQDIRQNPSHECNFNLQKLKNLVVPGASKLSYAQLWDVISHQWEKVTVLRQKVSELHAKKEELKKNDLVQLRTYQFAIAFIIKDLNIKESFFHQIRETLLQVEDAYPNLKEEFIRVRRCYSRYIECKNLMVNYNLKLVVSIARKFFRAKVSPMDVIQYGNEGLIRAAEDYNYKLKFKFSTYAIWWIRQKIQEGVQEQEHMIRIPAYRLHLSRKYSAIKDRLTQEGETVTDEMLSGELDLSVDQIKKLKSDPAAFVVSPQSDENEENGSSLDQLIDTRSLEEEKMFDEEATMALQSHLKLYPVRERFILTLRYGLRSEEIFPIERSVEEIEEMFSQMSEDMQDKQLDEAMPSFLYQFNQLPKEAKVAVDVFKRMKVEEKAPIEVVQELFPFNPKHLDTWREKLNNNEELDPKTRTILALIDGSEFSQYIKFKSRDRLIFNRIWLKVELKPSVVKKLLNHEGLILEEVAKIFGLTKERVRQIEAKILRNISYHLVLP